MNFGELKTAVARWANRTDLTPILPTLLELAEQRIYTGMTDANNQVVAPLRLSSMLVNTGPRDPVTQSTLPSDFLEAKRVSWYVTSTVKQPMDFLPLERMSLLESTGGRPAYYSLSNTNLVFGPNFTNQYELLYYQRFATPVNDTDANWLLVNASAVYLFSYLMEVATYLRNEDLYQQMRIKYVEAMNSVQNQDDGNKHSGAQLRIVSDATRYI
ncbi:hypothetical protein IP84_17035 [beta proteobacterium AAP99]|nr:hypothetical protein IP84_17035 [beta proteobacterium AAP99]